MQKFKTLQISQSAMEASPALQLPPTKLHNAILHKILQERVEHY
jgi:hypothetical protein